MHGSNRLGGNSLSDLLVFGKRAGDHAALYAHSLRNAPPAVTDAQIEAATRAALAPFLIEDRPNVERENAYTIHAELQQTMNDLVGIIRKADEIELALKKLDDLRSRAAVASVEGGREFNPGWHLAIDLQNMLLISECIAQAALAREESRGGHTRDDFPGMNPEWRKLNLVLATDTPTGLRDSQSRITLVKQEVPAMRADLLELFDPNELQKYLTDAELPASVAAAASDAPADQPQRG